MFKKKLLVFGLCAAMAVSAVGCTKSSKKSSDSKSEKTEDKSKKSSADDSKFSGEMSVTDGVYDIPEYKSKVTKLADYASLTVGSSTVEVSDVMMKSISSALIGASDLDLDLSAVTVDRAAEEGDICNIDYTGYKDGEAFDGGSATGYNLTLGSGTFIEGFEDGLVGHKAGESVSLDLTFPEDYSSEELAGAAVTFEVTINAIYGQEINDAFIEANASDVASFIYNNFYIYKAPTTKAKFEEDIKKVYKANVVASTLMTNIVDNSEVEIDEEELASFIEHMKSLYTSQAQLSNGDEMTFADLLKNYGMTEEDFNGVCESSFKQYVVFTEIARKEGVKVTEDEYNEYVQCIVDHSNGAFASIADYEVVYKPFDNLNTIMFGKTYEKMAEKVQYVSDDQTTTYTTTAAENETEESETTVAAEESEKASEKETETSEK